MDQAGRPQNFILMLNCNLACASLEDAAESCVANTQVDPPIHVYHVIKHVCSSEASEGTLLYAFELSPLKRGASQMTVKQNTFGEINKFHDSVNCDYIDSRCG